MDSLNFTPSQNEQSGEDTRTIADKVADLSADTEEEAVSIVMADQLHQIMAQVLTDRECVVLVLLHSVDVCKMPNA